ncbi:UDP-glycosyltransferase 76C1 [Zea mays]|uniref:UDP-glycosyltransferase 76C1 n=1 Tax=Zea mays TaxID=4577 RepID=A0A1D6E426_MAIZE|nr:UDP-glycosyltransferase 76C1 [Zea mays]
MRAARRLRFYGTEPGWIMDCARASHISPTLQLAALLHARGLAVTVLHTGLNAPDASRHPELTFVLIHESSFPDEDVACAVVDGQCYSALRAAHRLGVPALPLRTDSAATFRSMLDGSDTDALCGFVGHVADAVRASASGVVINTFERMEASELAKIQRELSRPAFAVGPLHLLSPAPTEQSLHAPDRGCLAWLDDHPLRSVLYVSLGSVACVDRGAFVEMAWGLARSGVSFLWVGRPGLVGGVARAGPTQTGRAGGRSSSRACCGGPGPAGG